MADRLMSSRPSRRTSPSTPPISPSRRHRGRRVLDRYAETMANCPPLRRMLQTRRSADFNLKCEMYHVRSSNVLDQITVHLTFDDIGHLTFEIEIRTAPPFATPPSARLFVSLIFCWTREK